MIGRLRGAVAEIGEEDAIIDVGGVGYLVRCGARTLSHLAALSDAATLHVETQWSDGVGFRLYGFAARDERAAFVLLQGIQGVGPKAALAVLDVLAPGELAAAVARQDKAAVARANGIGPKLAQRIVQELKGRAIAEGPIAAASLATDGRAASPAGDAVAALIALGWPEAVSRRAVDQAAQRLGEDAHDAALLKTALQDLGR